MDIDKIANEQASHNIELVINALHNKGENPSQWVLDAYVDAILAQLFDRYEKDEILNSMRTGALYKLREAILEEFMTDQNIRWMIEAEEMVATS